MSRLQPLRLTDRIFFVTVNLRRQVEPFGPSEFPLLLDVPKASPARLRFMLTGSIT